MYFDTPIYFVFLALVVSLYWRFDRRAQNILLLAASYFFYGWWDWRFLILIAISTLVDFHCARWIDRSEDSARRRLWVVFSLAINLGFLGFFKYFNFFEDSLLEVCQTLGIGGFSRRVLSIALPPAISFYTFQEVAYIIDVYRRRLTPASSLVDYALFVSLFPHLIAGPIQRPSHLLPQVQRPRVFDAERFYGGLMLILSGLFRKCVVADNCALLADAAFSGRLGAPNVLVLAIGMYAFVWQSYGDFSGYSDIARGSAQVLGFHFTVNFRQPYLARTMQDFWRRWHISLSTWFRDYLYIPLGGSRCGEWKTCRNILLTMLIAGLWHGANWTFVAWGGVLGVGLLVERLIHGRLGVVETKDPGLREIRASLLRPADWLQRILIFHLICLASVFFRAPSIMAAWEMLSGLTTWAWRPEFLIALKAIAFFSLPLFLVDLVNEYRQEEYPLETLAVQPRLAVAILLLLAVTLASGNSVNAFMYFQF
jgi:D-alanyl-lipoteichoic acid acyltransferase DltB (MBOAT superfamily)